MRKPKTFDRQLLLDCATEFLTWLGLQDPMYAERIEITKSEYHLDDLQVLGNYVARTLDLGEHMVYSEREFLLPNYAGHLGERECQICHQTFSGGRGTDLICSKPTCAAAYAEKLDKEFEARNAANAS